MKRFVFILVVLFCGVALADTINLNWKNGDTTYSQTSCTVGGDLNVPNTPPTKYGYDFVGWNVRAAKELEYISMDRSQYIDTGIKFDSDEIEYETKARFGNNYNTIFGAEGTCSGTLSMTNSAGTIFLKATYNDLSTAVGATVLSTTIVNGINTYRLYIKKSTNLFTLTVNDNVMNRGFSGTITSDKNIIIGQHGGTYCGFQGYLYYIRIKKDGVLVRDLIPAMDPDGVVSLYDRVSQTFFYNPTGTDLGAGPVKE